MPLFHLSLDENLEKLTPRVPLRVWNEHEDNYINRICFSESINGCLRALYASEGDVFNLYVPDRKTEIYKPDEKQVIDADITGELWALNEIRVIKIAKIKVVASKIVYTIPRQEVDIPVSDFKFLFRNLLEDREVRLWQAKTTSVEKSALTMPIFNAELQR